MSDEAIPAGFVLVPRELTHEMLDATCDTQADDAAMRDRWAALLDAAPKLATPAPCKASGDDGAGEPLQAREIAAQFYEKRDPLDKSYRDIAHNIRRGRYDDQDSVELVRFTIAALAASRPTDAGATVPLYTFDEAWDELVNKDDRTSPEEYPDMCLITRDELQCYMEAVQYAPAALATPKPPMDGAMRERERIIAEARKCLRLTQGCMECNAGDEQRWMDTIRWLEEQA